MTIETASVDHGQTFSILSFHNNKSGTSNASSKPYSIQRISDGEIFAIGDTVTNGTTMIGEIISFDLLESKIYVNHTYSGIGMNLDSLIKVTQPSSPNKLPSRFQLNDLVSIRFRPDFVVNEAKIIKVHFTESKVLYDLEVKISFDGNSSHPAGHTTTRIYNIDSAIVEPVGLP